MSVYVWMGVGEREEVREGSDVKNEMWIQCM